MFRRSREISPDSAASDLSQALEPLTVITWGPLALAHLGIPIIIGVIFFFKALPIDYGLNSNGLRDGLTYMRIYHS
jgi:hypothetical protein